MATHVDRVDTLASGLQRALEETGWSARGLSLAAGLGADAVRDVLRQQASTLTGDRLTRIAAVLGIDPAALTGETRWPKRRLAPAPAPAPSPRRPPLGATLSIPEVDVRLHAPGGGREILDPSRPRHHWRVPADLLEGRRLEVEALVIVRAPHDVEGAGIRGGDRLMVDVSVGARRLLAGVLVEWSHEAHGLVPVRGKRAGSVRLQEHSDGEDDQVVDVVGRVVGKWAWM